MRILVLSDSHGDYFSLKEAIRNEPTAETVIHLGDGLADLENAKFLLSNKKVVAVRGNCDSFIAPYPVYAIDYASGFYIYCTHGYTERVKESHDQLKKEALTRDCTIALYGHTHIPHTSYEDSLHIMNPGSVRLNSCGIIDITDKGIMCFTKKIVP